MEELMTIRKSRYEQLIKAKEKLDALIGAGVDNWEGYSDAMATLEDEE